MDKRAVAIGCDRMLSTWIICYVCEHLQKLSKICGLRFGHGSDAVFTRVQTSSKQNHFKA